MMRMERRCEVVQVGNLLPEKLDFLRSIKKDKYCCVFFSSSVSFFNP
jgi:hypothetical protein